MSRSKLSKVGIDLTWSGMFTEKKFLLCLQTKGLFLTQTIILA